MIEAPKPVEIPKGQLCKHRENGMILYANEHLMASSQYEFYGPPLGEPPAAPKGEDTSAGGVGGEATGGEGVGGETVGETGQLPEPVRHVDTEFEEGEDGGEVPPPAPSPAPTGKKR